jgi:chloride channel 7
MITIYTLYVVRTSEDLWGSADSTKMFSFGEFTYKTSDGKANFSVWELLLFTALGALGGLAGALFNHLNKRLTQWRMRHCSSKALRALEAWAVCVICSTVMYVVPCLWRRCTPKPLVQVTWTQFEKNLVEDLVPFGCPADSYNEVASLFFTDSDTAIKQLFHFRESGVFNQDVQTFSSLAIATFYVPYFLCACLTYGIAVPSGLFVPSLLGGAALGRLVGHLLHRLDAQSGTFADAGTYALVGAAAGLGGMARMTISLCVILLEATGNISNLLPLMLALMAARWVGNVFNEGLYDVHIHLKKMPILEEEVPAAAAERTAHAAQVMAADPVCFAPLVTVGDAYDVLRSCRHACFPVVAGGGSTQLAGTVLRSTICMLIQHRAFGAPGDDPSQRNDLRTRALSPLLSSAVFERAYPRFPTVDELDVSETDRGCWLDLRPYADTGPVTIQDCASIQRTYRVFRTLGLRHLVVVDAGNKVRGIITRKDLDHHTLEERLAWAANEAENLESFSVEA